MPARRSRSAAPERPRLAPAWSIGLLGAMVSFVLFLIYPHEDLVERVYDAPAGAVTEAYLANLLRTDPRNPRLRLLLARNHFQLGQYERIHQTLGPALEAADPALRREAAWLLWQAMEMQWARLPAASPLRPQLKADLDSRLAEMARWDMPENELALLARKAFALGNRAVGMAILERLARQGSGRSAHWFEEAGREALAASDHRAAADFYLAAARHALLPGERHQHFRAALRALQAGNRGADALAMAEGALKEMPELGQDPETLILLVTLARGAQRPDLADKYVRPLLRMSLLKQWQDQLLAARGFNAFPRRVALAGEETDGPRLPFDDRAYTLGYEVFLENRKLEDAWKVAASAVRQAPDNLAWRERLAQVSEWTGRSRQALDNWLYLARRSGREDAWQAVLRLAPGLYDDDALGAALQHQLARHPGDFKLLAELADLYERQGDPRRALALLAGQVDRQPRLLARLAELAERAGDDALALEYWRRHVAEAAAGRPTPPEAVRIATLMLRRGLAREALEVLEKARPVDAGETAFWRLTAEVARLARREEAAVAAYRTLVAGPAAQESDYEALYQLLAAAYPIEAAQLAAAAWRRFGREEQLLRALGIYSRREHWSDMAHLLAEVDAGQMAGLRRQPEFLLHSARYRQHRGSPAEARRDLEAALGLAPRSSDVRQAWLWLLIDDNDAPGLRRLLSGHEDEWRADPQLHDALAAAYQSLSLPAVALQRYLTPRLGTHREDFLWLMNYADALEQNQEADRAWRLRQHLLARERARNPGRDWLTDVVPEEDEEEEVRRIARVRLAVAQRRGDPGLAVLRELLRLDRDAQGRPSPAAAQVAAGWLQDGGHYQAERGWLWQQFARSASRPLWAEITVALAEDEREEAGRLLERYAEALPRYDRINAARRVDDVRLAQSDAFDTSSAQPDDHPLHLQLTDALLAHSDHAGAAWARRDLGPVAENEGAIRWHLALAPRLSLDLALGSIARRDQGGAPTVGAPDEHYRSARLAWRHPDGETRLLAEERRAFATYRPLQVEHEQRLDEALSLTASLASDLPSSESLSLRLAGMKDRAGFGLRHQATRRDRIFFEQAYERYRAQTGEGLGTGRHLRLEYAHALRLESPDLEAGAFWSSHGYRRQGPALPAPLPADMVPEGFRFYGLRLSTGLRFQEEYTRAWRPYAALTRTWHSGSGPGYELAAGIAGSVFGADHLGFGWRLAKAGLTTGSLVREIGFSYRLHY